MANPRAFNRTKSLINLLEKKGERASEGTLRLETLLGTSGSYTFQVNENQNKLISEIRLRSGDAFLPTKVGMFLKKVTCTANAPTDAQLSIGILNTFPNPLIFTNNTQAEANNLEALYNSRIQINVNSVNLTEFMDTLRFRRVGQAQQLQQTTVTATVGVYGRSEWLGVDYGFCPYEQDIAFNGQANNQVQVILPTAVDCSSAGGGSAVTTQNNYLVVIFKGILVQNGAKNVNDKTIKTFNMNA